MNFLEVMQQRYTTKSYDATKKIDKDTIDRLTEILRLSPSSINSQPWAFKLVSDDTTKAKLAEHSFFNAEKVRNCSHIVVLCIYKDQATFESERLSELPQPAADYYRAMVAPRGEAAVMSWLARQVYIALGVLLSAAAVEGIDSTPMEGIDTEAYTEVLGLDKYKTLVAVALGVRAKDDKNQPTITPKSRRTDIII